MFKLPLQKSLIFSLVFSACGLIGVLISAFCVDKFGRKPVLVVGFLATIIVCAALAFDGITSAYHLLFTVSTGGVFLSASTVVLYLYTPELYPTRMRALGCSVSTVWMRIASALGPNAVAVVVAKYSLSAMFVIFGAIAAVGLIVIVLFGIETKSRVLEEVSP
jgi:putative MFS transporter